MAETIRLGPMTEAHTTIGALRKTYGQTFAPGFRSDDTLSLLLRSTGTASLEEYLTHSDDEDQDASSLRGDDTGVDNTVFVSTEGRARHAPRIKIAIDPPDSFNATSKTASMAFHDYSVTGAYVPPRLVEQATRFIERNRDVLLRYWDAKISTREMLDQIRKPD
jgi:hypothetical protein